MKYAYNSKGKLVNIIESIEEDTYTCPVCKEYLTRNFGAKKQYYSHPKQKGDNCELKMKLMLKENSGEISESQLEILKKEYYDKVFNNINIEYSDYQSEEGYFLTSEQKDIIFANEDKIKISALAGSAKSSTLYYYAKERPHKKILYIVYNKAMKDEAEKSFGKLKHVSIKTIHGLAYGYVGRFYSSKLTLNYGVVDIIKDLNLDWNRDMELAAKINHMMKEYMLSDAHSFNELELYKDDKKNRDTIVLLCEKLWDLKKEYKNNVKIEHDFYLKLFQLSQMDLSNTYDIVLLDESQDGSMLLLDIIKNSKVKGIVMVGDRFQQLYVWRRALNIMEYFEAKEYKLTTSFRVSQNIANIANLVVMDISKNDIQMKGFNTKQRIVDEIDKNKSYACLCRTNAFIFAEVIEVIRSNINKKLYFEGGYKSYNFNNVKDCYYFSVGKEVNNPILKKFKNYYEMKDYAERLEDLELLALIKIVDNYGSDIPKIVDSIKDNTVNKKEIADVVFSTIHRSKGQTYSIPVYISSDHFDIEEVFKKAYLNKYDVENKINKFNLRDFYEEMCILYVAITRCAGEIELSDKLKNYLLLRNKVFGDRISHEYRETVKNIV